MIDWSRVHELKDEIGDEDFDEVVEMFFAEVEEVILRLKTAPDPTCLEHDMHFLKSSALNLGFSKMSSLCMDGERRAASGDGALIGLEEVFRTWDESKAAFLSG